MTSKGPTYLTPDDIAARIAQLDTGEIPDAGEVVPEYDSPQDFYRMFPDLLCKHGFNKKTCYPCAPLPDDYSKGGKMDEHTNLEKLSTTELLNWLEKQNLYGLDRILAKRLKTHYDAYYRLRNEARHMRARLREVYDDHSF